MYIICITFDKKFGLKYASKSYLKISFYNENPKVNNFGLREEQSISFQ